MPLAGIEGGADLGSVIRKRLRLEPDPFAFLKPVSDIASGIGSAVGGAFEAAHKAPVVGGALDALGAIGDATVGTPVGLAELGADQFLHTGLSDAAQRANAGRPFWELPKTAAGLTRGALGQIAGDTSQDPFSRGLAGLAGTTQDVGSFVAPIPGAGQVAGALGRGARLLPPALERSLGEAAPAAGFFDRRLPEPVTAGRRAPKPDISTNEGFRAQIEASKARQAANPTPTADLANRAPISARDTGGGTFAQPPDTSLADALKASIENIQNKRINVPRDAEQIAAETGRATRPQVETALRLGQEADVRQAKMQGTIASAGMTGPLTGRAIGPGSSQLARAGHAVEGLDATPDQIASSLERQAKVHNANEAAIATAREYAKDPSAANAAAHERALRDVKLLGGSLDHTAARIRSALKAEGLPAPTAGDISAAKSRTPLGDAIARRAEKAETSAPVAAAPAEHSIAFDKTSLRWNVKDASGKVVGQGDTRAQAIKDARANIAPAAPSNVINFDMAKERRLAKEFAGERATTDMLKAEIARRRGGEPPTTPPAPPTGAPQPASPLDHFLSVWNLPKALKASLDISAPFRQGVLLSAGHPGEFFGAFVPMLRSLTNPKFAQGLDAAIRETPRPGLYLAPLDAAKLGAREEAFMSSLADKLPGVSASNRAYVTFLNKLRADVYDNVLDGWKSAGKGVTEADAKGLADIINHFTGRGDLPTQGATATAVLNGMFFSPRFAISRVQSVGDALGGLRPGASLASKEAATNLTKFVGAGLAVLTLAQMAGYKVGSDPRSSDFGKIQIGPVQVDIWGGEQQMARYGAQLITGQRVTASGKNAGKVEDQPRGDTLTRFVRSKLSPSAGTVNDILGLVGGGGTTAKDRKANANLPFGDQIIGRNFVGNPVTPAGLISPMGPNSLIAPLGWQDTLDAARQGSPLGALSLLGFGVTTKDAPPTIPSAPAQPSPSGTFQLRPPGKTPSNTTPPSGTFQLRPPSGTNITPPSPSLRLTPPGQGGKQPSLLTPQAPSSVVPQDDVASTIAATAQQNGIDPRLAIAVAQMESGLNPNAVGDNGDSHGLFQENVHGRGAGRAPDYDVARQTQRFAADVRRLLASGFTGTPGEIAAAAQRPYDPVGYARKIDAIYGSLR